MMRTPAPKVEQDVGGAEGRVNTPREGLLNVSSPGVTAEEVCRRMQSHFLRRGDRKGQSLLILLQEVSRTSEEEGVRLTGGLAAPRDPVSPPPLLTRINPKKVDRPSPRRAFAPISPNVKGERTTASALNDQIASSHSSPSLRLELRRTGRGKEKECSTEDRSGSQDAVVQVHMGSPCCAGLLEKAMRDRDKALQDLEVLRDVTDEVVLQTGAAVGRGDTDEGNLRPLLARAQAAIAAERVEHVRLQSKYKRVVRQVVDLSKALQCQQHASHAHVGSNSPDIALCERETQAAGPLCDTPRSDMSSQTESGGQKCDAATGEDMSAEMQQAALDNERAQWREMIEESEERCRALIEHLTVIQSDEDRVIKLLTKKVSVLTEERNTAHTKLLALSSAKSPRSSQRRSSGSSPRSSPRAASKPLPSLPEDDSQVEENVSVETQEHVTITRERDQETEDDDGDQTSTSAAPAPPLEEMMLSPPPLSLPSANLGETPSRYTPSGQPQSTTQHEVAANRSDGSPLVVRTPERGAGTGGEEGLSDEEKEDTNFFHRFFSQPDFDSSVAAWIKLQAFDQMLDVAPHTVGTWINAELPWERKEDQSQSFEEGFLKLFFL